MVFCGLGIRIREVLLAVAVCAYLCSDEWCCHELLIDYLIVDTNRLKSQLHGDEGGRGQQSQPFGKYCHGGAGLHRHDGDEVLEGDEDQEEEAQEDATLVLMLGGGIRIWRPRAV